MSFSILLFLILGLLICWYFFYNLNKKIAFKELFYFLYGINYLLSPAIIYLIPEQYVFYKMRIPADKYFYSASIGLSGILIGINLIKTTNLFKPNIQLLQIESRMNEKTLKFWIFGGIFLNLISSILPTEIAFLIYLLSLIRYVGAFGLFSLNMNFKYVLPVLGFEFFISLRYGMFHDFIMWSIFFIIYYMYLKKVSKTRKIILLAFSLFIISLIQNVKTSYRDALSRQEVSGISTFLQSIFSNQDYEQNINYFYSTNFVTGITRVNQGWILASTIDNMERYQNFQNLTIVNEYLQAALLPRILLPDKIRAGDKKIFNQFSGTNISENTSMGLGIFADGFVAYGEFGVFLFGLLFGFLFSIIFKIISIWTSISPFFFLFIFPILNYAIRPDCELQTILGHIIKSLIVYGLFVSYYKGSFQKKVILLNKLDSNKYAGF